MKPTPVRASSAQLTLILPSQRLAKLDVSHRAEVVRALSALLLTALEEQSGRAKEANDETK